MDDRGGRSLAAGGCSAAVPASASRRPASKPRRQPAAPPPGSVAAGTSGAAENPGLFNEMGKVLEKSLSILPTLKSPGETLDDLNARAKDAARNAGEGLSRLAKPSSMADGPHQVSRVGQRRADCKVGGRQALPGQGLQGRQEPVDGFGGSLFGESADPGPDPQARTIAEPTISSPARCASRRLSSGRSAQMHLAPVGFDRIRSVADCRSLDMMSGIFIYRDTALDPLPGR